MHNPVLVVDGRHSVDIDDHLDCLLSQKQDWAKKVRSIIKMLSSLDFGLDR